MGGFSRSLAVWDHVIERVEKKMACWKHSYILFGGQITLIKASLSNIPIYYMCLFKMPSKIANILEKYFLWEDSNGKKDHLVKWLDVCKPRHMGGLGIGNLEEEMLCC